MCAAESVQPSGTHHVKWALVAMGAACVLLIGALIFRGMVTLVADQSQPPVSAVYITPAPAPVTLAPTALAPVEAPVVKPVPAAPVAPPTTQVVQLPKEIHYQRLRTQMLGATTGGGPYQMLGTNNEPIIGFRVTTARWDGKSIVRTLQPVYPSDNSVVIRSMVVARPGYAVGGVVVDGDDHVTAMQVIFMRILPHGLSVKDSYESDWIGEPTGDTTTVLGGRGEFVIGIYGRKGMNVDALGLLLLGETSD